MTQSKPPELQRVLGLWATVSIVIGSIIGSGIFLKPALMASQLGSPQLLIAVWVLAGLVTLFGALSNAEVAAMMPVTGGQYVFFKKMYGDFVAFLYGWAAFTVINTAGVASIAYVAGIYTEYFVQLPRLPVAIEQHFYANIPFIGKLYPLENIGVKTLTILLIALFTYINYRSTQSGGLLQVVFTGVKVGAILLVVFGIFFSGSGNPSNFSAHGVVPQGWAFTLALVAALSGAFWSYDGWNNSTFVAGEIQNPQKTIPKSLLIGIIVCTVIYTLVTLSFLYVKPVEAMAHSSFIASDAAQVALGAVGGALISLLVIISVVGAANGNILSTARVSFAMAKEKRFFRWTSFIHPTYKTPANAILLHSAWSSLLVLSGSFDMLTDMLIFVSWLFYGLSALGVFVLRFKMPHAPRPYKVWGYPVVPAVFVLFTLFFVVFTLINDIQNYAAERTPVINSLLGLLLVVTGIPFYFYFRKAKK